MAARGAIVTMKGTNVPVWALRKSLCQASVKSAGAGRVRRRVGEGDDRLAFLAERLLDAFELAAIGRLRSRGGGRRCNATAVIPHAKRDRASMPD